MLFYTTSLCPSIGDPTAMYTPPLRYKREEYVKPGQVKPDTTQARIHSEQSRSQPLESTSNTTHSGRRVLRSGGPNHSKPIMFIVFLHLDLLILATPKYSPSGFRRMHYATRLWVCTPRQILYFKTLHIRIKYSKRQY